MSRVVLYAWSATDDPRIENIACLELDGSVRWRALLPEGSTPDCFTELERAGSGVLASTWSGRRMRLDPATGLTIKFASEPASACHR